MSEDGLTLPVVDVTSPRFAVSATEMELSAMSGQFVQEARHRQQLSPAALEALQRSMLGRGLMAASGTILSGMSTYLLKLGPDNLGPEATPVDRRIAGSFPAFTTRLRLQDMARLLADRLSLMLATDPGRPLCFINIAGGPASDSWNALIHLRLENPELLSDRRIELTVFDPDRRGPAFGASALSVLTARDAPLSGLSLRFLHVSYDWTDASRMPQALRDLDGVHSACAISSEGGLFEYGSDLEIVANLGELHAGTAPDAIVVGSVTRDSDPVRSSHASTGISTRPRSLDSFRELATTARWTLTHVVERPFNYNVCMAKAR